MENSKVFMMPFSKVYACLINKALKKNRTLEEVYEVTCWLTGYHEKQLQQLQESTICYGDFFREAPCLNPDRVLIKGKICGVDIESIEDDLMKEIRYLDKLIDELAKGKTLDKIKRSHK